MRFVNGSLLWLLLLNLVIWLLWYWRRKSTIVFSSVMRMGGVKTDKGRSSLRRRLSRGVIILRMIAFSALIIALARPQASAGVEYVKSEVIDIIITLDTSLSMGAKDFERGNRLEVAKEMIDRFVDSRKGDRIGLISFAAYSQLRCPLTLDHEILKVLLKDIEIVDRTDPEANGTAIGLSLANSIDHLRGSAAKSRVIVLLTDGDNNITKIEPQTSAEIARVMGVKIYTVGVGTFGVGKSGLVPMPSHNPADPPDTFTLQPSGFNEDVLRQIAGSTGGHYYHAVDRESFQAIFKDIDSLERTAIDVRRYEHYQEKFLPWVILAIIAILTDLTLQHTYLKVLP